MLIVSALVVQRMSMILPNWAEAFEAVCSRGHNALEWGLPEPWIHAELYAELKQRVAVSGWIPFSTEIPYVTFYPVQLPKHTYRDWRVVGAVKWVDLCLRAEGHNAWCWFEFKVRHAGYGERHQEATRQAMTAVRKDIVALVGFSADLTANTWEYPDEHTRAYWFEDILQPLARDVRSGQHIFAMAFLQLGGDLDPGIWNKNRLIDEVREWLAYRSRQSGRQPIFPTISVTVSPQSLAGGHSLVICEWEPEQIGEE